MLVVDSVPLPKQRDLVPALLANATLLVCSSADDA